MAMIRKCTFTSVWDDETVVISTKAKIDLNSGKVFNIGPADALGEDGNEVGSLDREFVRLEGIEREFGVKPFDDVSCAIADLAEFKAALVQLKLLIAGNPSN
jgi:hypothetical protein